MSIARPLLVLAIGAVLHPEPAVGQLDLRVQADAVGVDARNLNGEYALIVNRERVPVELSRWRLCDAVLDCYVFPEDVMLPPGGRLRVYSGEGRDTPRALYMGRDRPLWADWSDIATLTDTSGEVRARCVWDRGRGLDCTPP